MVLRVLGESHGEKLTVKVNEKVMERNRMKNEMKANKPLRHERFPV